MVTSGAQSKAINDWLIPSVEVSCVWIQTGNTDEVTSFIGTLSDIWSDRASQESLSQVSEVLTTEAMADSAGRWKSGCLCTSTQEVMGCDTALFLLQGRLTGLGGEDLPTVVIVAHYDSFGVAPVSILSSCSSLFLSFFPYGLCPRVFSWP